MVPSKHKLFSSFLGGQFEPDSGGQFGPDSGGQFQPAEVVNLNRILQSVVKFILSFSIKTCVYFRLTKLSKKFAEPITHNVLQICDGRDFCH